MDLISDESPSSQTYSTPDLRVQALADAVPVGILQTDVRGNGQLVNQRWCELAGLPAAEAAGLGWMQALHPDDRQRAFDEWYGAASSGQDFDLDYRLRRPDGTIAWVVG